MNPFSRTELLLGKEALARLEASRVAVFGLGAVGSYAVEALARAGVGQFVLVDFDVVRETNLNRQLYALTSTIGRPKAELARNRVLEINPSCHVEAKAVFVHNDTIASLLSPAPRLVIDAIDSLRPKVVLLETCARAGLPVISAMGAACRTNPALVRAGDLSETRHCPLARLVRKCLRRAGITSGIRCIYSLEPMAADAVSTIPEEDGYKRGRPRRPIGSLSYMTGLFGLWAASEAIHFLSGRKPAA